MTSSEKRSSKQSERTKNNFKEAFITLVHEKGFSHVSVTDIVKKADYNRTTFYLYYQDKYCLSDELKAQMYQQIKETSMNKYEKGKSVTTGTMHAGSFELTQFMYANQAFFNLYTIEDTIPSLHRDLPQAIYEVLKEHFQLVSVNQDRDINYDAHKLYMAHGTAGLLVDWIEKGYPISPNDMAERLIHILESFAKEFKVTSRG
ncbi:TetR/AcrR family transcriptional regulator [Shouchella lehensis]|uniref:HTH-type transcriptional regulator n=1 Tax=Shouchella lehensis G1 TaxID=1246626 RepID=A0A060M2B7_9BACI|nr:TetR/AcrR family transcriptional regulator [Shouchella lehensis]AIC96170.1 HTH-type transcriptional regulator [Shouchella lehensis G1]RQW18781.1 TetR/AcrR family transcriptional regulator [Bacillus sp. C1-1]